MEVLGSTTIALLDDDAPSWELLYRGSALRSQLSVLGFRRTPRLAPKLDAHGLFIAGLIRKQVLLPFLAQICAFGRRWAANRINELGPSLISRRALQ